MRRNSFQKCINGGHTDGGETLGLLNHESFSPLLNDERIVSEKKISGAAGGDLKSFWPSYKSLFYLFSISIRITFKPKRNYHQIEIKSGRWSNSLDGSQMRSLPVAIRRSLAFLECWWSICEIVPFRTLTMPISFNSMHFSRINSLMASSIVIYST